jgi:hypothetical protein
MYLMQIEYKLANIDFLIANLIKCSDELRGSTTYSNKCFIVSLCIASLHKMLLSVWQWKFLHIQKSKKNILPILEDNILECTQSNWLY